VQVNKNVDTSFEWLAFIATKTTKLPSVVSISQYFVKFLSISYWNWKCDVEASLFSSSGQIPILDRPI